MLEVVNELLPNGYLRITQKGTTPEGQSYTNVEIYHKQMSVMPYSAAVSGAVVGPLLVVCLIVFFIWRKRKRSQKNAVPVAFAANETTQPPVYHQKQ